MEKYLNSFLDVTMIPKPEIITIKENYRMPHMNIIAKILKILVTRK